MWSRAVGKSEVEQRARGRQEQARGGRERGGNPLQCTRNRIRSTKAWAAAMNGGDRVGGERHECGDWRTRLKPAGLLTGGPGPVKKYYFQIPIQLNLVNSKWKPFLAPRILKFCMGLDLHIQNNFLNWVNFKFARGSKLVGKMWQIHYNSISTRYSQK
jgi:hypothetical protein